MTIDLGGLDLEVDTTSSTVSGVATVALGGLSLTVTSGRPSAALYDENGDWVCNLPLAAGIQWQDQISVAGSLTMRLPLDDSATALATPKRILKVFWRGQARQAARIDSSSVDVAVDGRRWREFNQLPGVLNMLADGLIYPEYGKDRSTSGARSFGPMSKHGAWYSSGNWTRALGTRYLDDTSHKRGKPEGLSYPNPMWIAKNGADHGEATGATQFFRRAFTTSSTIQYQILATGDNYLTLWLDGEKLYETDRQSALEWMFLQQITGDLPAGPHVLAAKVVNGRGFFTNPIGLIVTLQKMQPDGTVTPGSPVINTDTRWVVANNGPGFRRGDVFATNWAEAKARNVKAFQVLTLGFDHARASDGAPWTDTPDQYDLDVMSTQLDAAQILTEKDFELAVDYDTLTVKGYNDLGSDLSGTVTLQAGVSLVSHRVDRVEAKFNTALVQLSDGTYKEFHDAASLAAYGRIETGLSLGGTSDGQTASDVATGAFAENADTAYTFTTQISDLTGPQVYRDFTRGDSVSLEDDAGNMVKVRVISVTVDASGDRITVTPELALDPS